MRLLFQRFHPVSGEPCPMRFLPLEEQIRFPRSKKKRIRKKWAKRPENWRVVPDPSYVFNVPTLDLHRGPIVMEPPRVCAFPAKRAVPDDIDLHFAVAQLIGLRHTTSQH
jgi:hypothetical protein